MSLAVIFWSWFDLKVTIKFYIIGGHLGFKHCNEFQSLNNEFPTRKNYKKTYYITLGVVYMKIHQ